MIGLWENISFCFDPLAVFFLIVIAVVSIPSLIYSYGYLAGHYSRARISVITSGTILFILSMAAVVCSANLLVFLLS